MKNKWDDYKKIEGLVWGKYNHSVYGFNPYDDDLIRKSFNFYRSGDEGRIECTFEGDEDNRVIFRGTIREAITALDNIADRRIDPKMLCHDMSPLIEQIEQEAHWFDPDYNKNQQVEKSPQKAAEK